VFGGRYGGCYFEVIFGEFRIFGRRHGVQLAPLTTRYCAVRQTIPIAKQQSSSLSLIHSAIEPNICPEKRRADATNFHVNRAKDCRWACIYCTHVRLEGRRKVAFLRSIVMLQSPRAILRRIDYSALRLVARGG
jgi:hypothetical protein